VKPATSPLAAVRRSDVAIGHWAAQRFVLHAPPAYNSSPEYAAACLCRFPQIFFIGDSTVRQLYGDSLSLDPHEDPISWREGLLPCGTRAYFLFHAFPVYASRMRAFGLPGENDLLERLIDGRTATPGGALVILSLGQHFVRA
jgi:hypothetical protein